MVIEGINSYKLDLAKNFFYENGDEGRYELIGRKAFLTPQLVQRIGTIILELISNVVFKEVALVIAKRKDDMPLAYEVAKRLGVTFAHPFTTDGLYYSKEHYKHQEKIKSLIVSYDMSKEDHIDNLIDDPKIEVVAYACIVKFGDPETNNHKAPIYTLYTSEQMNSIIDYFLSVDLKERKEKFVNAVK